MTLLIHEIDKNIINKLLDVMWSECNIAIKRIP